MKFFLRAAVPTALSAALLVAIAPATAAFAAPVMENTPGLRSLVNLTGQYSTSIDALGLSGGVASGTVQVEKPAGATVHSAYLITSNGGSSCLVPTDLQLEGSVVDFDAGVSTSSCSLLDDVTAIVAPVVDAATAGVVDLDIIEGPQAAFMIEGSLLAVVFNDPSVANATVLLRWGTSVASGQLTDFTFPALIASDLAANDIELSVGISFSYQSPQGFGQSSVVELDSVIVSRTAGDRDDCFQPASCGNGGLITAGGVGDSLDLPAGAAANAPDDELYRVNDFLAAGDTSVQLHTTSLSGDDWVFFAGLYIPSTPPIVAAVPAAPAALAALPDTGVPGTTSLVATTAILTTLLGGALLVSRRRGGARVRSSGRLG